jgi:hypothetical protein
MINYLVYGNMSNHVFGVDQNKIHSCDVFLLFLKRKEN